MSLSVPSVPLLCLPGISISPRYFPSRSGEQQFFPTIPSYTSFAGPVDISTFKLRPNIDWPEGQEKACCFVKLGTYIMPEKDTLPPFKGIHPFHVFVFFPLLQQPWASMCAWMKKPSANGPFTSRTWLSVSGLIVGILNRNLLQEGPDNGDDCPILIITPDTFEIIPALTTSAPIQDLDDSAMNIPSPSTPSKILSRNPFSSPAKMTTPIKSLVSVPSSQIPEGILSTLLYLFNLLIILNSPYSVSAPFYIGY